MICEWIVIADNRTLVELTLPDSSGAVVSGYCNETTKSKTVLNI